MKTMENTVQAPQELSFRKRLLRKLFPYNQKGLIERMQFIEKGSGHGLITETYCFFDWKDRLRILFGGILHVEVRSNTEHDPGKSKSSSWVNVQPPGSMSPLRQK